VIEQWNIGEVETIAGLVREQGFVFAAPVRADGENAEFGATANRKYQALVTNHRAAAQRSSAINGTPRRLRTLLRFGDFQCYPTMFRGCIERRCFLSVRAAAQVAGNLLRDGSLKKNLRGGKEDLWRYPAVQGICYLFGNVLSHYYVKTFGGWREILFAKPTGLNFHKHISSY